MINHNTYNIAEQYVWHVRTQASHAYAGMPLATDKVKESIYYQSRPDTLIIVRATLT